MPAMTGVRSANEVSYCRGRLRFLEGEARGGQTGPGEVRFRRRDEEWGTLVEFDAPAVRNAINRATAEALLDVFTEPRSGAVAVTSRGPVFSAGGDLAELRGLLDEGRITETLRESMGVFHDLIAAIVACPRPTVAAIHGIAAGGGMSLALACDVRIGTRTAAFRPAFLRAGATPDGAATLLLARAVGPATAKAVLLTNRLIEATSALGALIFEEVLDDEAGLVERAIAVARRLASLNPHAVRLTKGLIEATAGSLTDQLERERDASLQNAVTAEFAQRLREILGSGRRGDHA